MPVGRSISSIRTCRCPSWSESRIVFARDEVAEGLRDALCHRSGFAGEFTTINRRQRMHITSARGQKGLLAALQNAQRHRHLIHRNARVLAGFDHQRPRDTGKATTVERRSLHEVVMHHKNVRTCTLAKLATRVREDCLPCPACFRVRQGAGIFAIRSRFDAHEATTLISSPRHGHSGLGQRPRFKHGGNHSHCGRVVTAIRAQRTITTRHGDAYAGI